MAEEEMGADSIDVSQLGNIIYPLYRSRLSVWMHKDYQVGDRWKTRLLPGEELIRRYLLHLLPEGLMRIRHYGFLANRCRKAKLAKIRQWLGQIVDEEPADESTQAENNELPCPKCHQGQRSDASSVGSVADQSHRQLTKKRLR